MNASEWLASRTPPPEPLGERVRLLLERTPAASGELSHDTLARGAEERLAELLARGDHSRTIASDLLAIDALTTYACEAAAEHLDPQALVEWSEAFAKRVAALGGSAAGAAFRSGSDAGVVRRSRSEKPRSAKPSSA